MIAIIDMDDELSDVDVESVCNALTESLHASDVRIEQMLEGKAKAIREVVQKEKERVAGVTYQPTANYQWTRR